MKNGLISLQSAAPEIPAELIKTPKTVNISKKYSLF